MAASNVLGELYGGKRTRLPSPRAHVYDNGWEAPINAVRGYLIQPPLH
jgi:hypothetical protein